ncbi:MAG TPA: Mur ligase family protein, partial [Bacteroidales bacterium]|nr:Mur ligase family protein [Bacteroidales bacterium]
MMLDDPVNRSLTSEKKCSYGWWDEDELSAAVIDFGYPLVIKPNDGNQGKGVTVNIRTEEALIAAFRKAKEYSEIIIAEKFYAGHDYRILVINYELVAASLRTPALVIGDGISTISELIREVNKDPRRGDEHENILTKIRIDDSTIEMLRKQNLGLNSIIPEGTRVILKHTANLSTGGTAEDVTHLVHPGITAVLQRAARVIGLDICGIDFVCNDISKPLDKECAIIEVNAAPGFRMHTHPSLGKPRPVGEAVVNMLFPGHGTGRIPIIAVTGTNGKTTTTRIIAQILRTAGLIAGYTTTEGIYIGNDLVEEGDCTGPVSAEKVLRDRSVEVAVLECARGGMLRSGLAYDRCDVGVVTNVAEDHIGLKNINSLEDMIRVKSIVPESVRRNGYAVLNENDPSVLGMRKNLKCRVALYSINGESIRIREHCRNGGIAATYREQRIILLNGARVVFSENIMKIPVAFGGKAPFMIENLLAAITASYCSNIGVETIRAALRSFLPSFESNPGRMNLIELSNITFI